MKSIKFWIGIAVSALIMFYLFRRVDYGELKAALAGANYAYLTAGVGVVILSLVIRAVRWRYLFLPTERIGYGSLFHSVTIGFMANQILPARLGEFVRAYVIGERERVSKVTSFATIVVERVFDGFMVVALIFLALEHISSFPEKETWSRHLGLIGWGSMGFYCAVLVFLYLVKTHTVGTVNLCGRILSFLPDRINRRFSRELHHFARGLQSIRVERNLVWVILYSALLWGSMAFVNFFIIRSFGLRLPLMASYVLMALQAISVALPSSPGFVGPFHYATVLGLGFYGVSKETALGAAIVIHISFFLTFTILGLILLWADNISFREISRAGLDEE